MPETDHEKTIRTALERGTILCSDSSCSPCAVIRASLSALQEERERMRAAFREITALTSTCPVCGIDTEYAPHADGCLFAAAMEPAPQFNRDEKWLREKAALEDGCFVSVGGLVTDLESLATPQEAALSRMCQKCGHPNHKSRIHQDVCTFYVQALGAECGCAAPQEGRS